MVHESGVEEGRQMGPLSCSPRGRARGRSTGLGRAALGALFLLPFIASVIPAPETPDMNDAVHPSPPNRLAREKSPYLLQHARNPVDWYPWGEEAFARARAEDKPVFLSVGYSTCHWCHVMERESFEDEKVAQYLNEHFICIKIDREERPDVDKIYMTAMQAMG